MYHKKGDKTNKNMPKANLSRMLGKQLFTHSNSQTEVSDSASSGSFNKTKSKVKHKGTSNKRKTTTSSTIKGRSRKKQKKEVCADLSDNLFMLNETENLFHSNIFKLQTEELLKEVRLKESLREKINDWVAELHTFIMEIPNSDQYKLSDHTWCDKMEVHVPLHMEPITSKGTFRYCKPASISLCGSFPVDLCQKPRIRVDVRVEMPQDNLLSSDFLNQLYHRKRAIYLTYLAAHLKSCPSVSVLQFSHHLGDTMRPVLLLTPDGKLGKRVEVVLLVTPPDNCFSPSRFVPRLNNVRPHWYFQRERLEDEPLNPTPHYNTSILIDVLMLQTDEYRSRVIERNTNIRDAVLLLNVWLRQRGLDEGFGAFSPFIMSMFVVYLVQSNIVSMKMNIYQILHTTWLSLVDSDWTTNGITLAQLSHKQPTLDEFHSVFDVVFIDSSGFMNFCANMVKDTFYQVKHEAQLALSALKSQTGSCFDILFISTKTFIRSFDHVFMIKQTAAPKELHLENEILDYSGSSYPVLLSNILVTLKKALMNRVKLLGVKLEPPNKWSIHEPPSLMGNISLGFLLNPEFSLNMLERGPSADSPEAAAFIEFWGEKSELRRFQDGSICEACVWPAETLCQKRIITKKIVLYVLRHKLHLRKELLMYRALQLDTFLRRRVCHFDSQRYGTGEEQSVKLIHLLDSLSKDIKNLEGLPLDITSVQGVSPVFRHTDVFPPLPFDASTSTNTRGNCVVPTVDRKTGKLSEVCDPLEVLVRMESSSRWPSDIEALQHVKAAFHIRLSELIEQQLHLTTQPYKSYVDVLKSGFVFRFRIVCQQELNLLRSSKSPEGVILLRDTPESLSLHRDTVSLSQLTSAIHSIQMRFTAFSSTCRLAKRWLSAQMMLDYLIEPAVELLVASCFLSPLPYSVPSQPQVGFLRFLSLLANTDWRTTPIIVNLNDELGTEDISEIEKKFNGSRGYLPPMFISSPYDKFQSSWTRSSPTLQVLLRIMQLAKEASNLLEAQLLNTTLFDFKMAFRPPLDVYDVIIHLNEHLLPRRSLAVDNDHMEEEFIKEYQPKPDEKIPVVGFDVSEFYLRDLRQAYGHIAMFFYDKFGGTVIGVVWKPAAFKIQQRKSQQLIGAHMFIDNNFEQMTANLEVAVEDFKILGKGLVRSVETRTEKWNVARNSTME